MVTVEQAQKLILKNIQSLAPKVLHLEDALGSVLAENLRAKEAIPFWNNSAVDGFALKSKDAAKASPTKPILLKIRKTIFAGDFPRQILRSGETMRIMTGAPLPEGADAVVMQEEVADASAPMKSWDLSSAFKIQSSRFKYIQVSKPVKKWENVRKAGEDVRAKETVLKSGTILTPAALGMCAAMGVCKVRAVPKPRIAIFSTGNELLSAKQKIVPGRIRDSNGCLLMNLAGERGLPAQFLGVARDQPEQIRKKLNQALCCSDLTVSSGGVSVGAADYLQAVLKSLKAKIVFWKVAMKPGKPVLFALLKEKPFFGLPGNPVSAFATFHLFVLPAIAKLSGIHSPANCFAYARLLSPLKGNFSRRTFLRGVCSSDCSGTSWVKFFSKQGSHQLSALLRANCFLDIPQGKINLHKGAVVRILLLKNL